MKRLWVVGLLIGVLSLVGARETIALTAAEIVERSESVYPGQDQKSKLTFLIRRSSGEERKIILRRYWKRYPSKNREPISKILVFNEYPPETNGSSFMVWSYDYTSGKQDEQWLYIPVLRKVEKVPDPVDEFFGETSIRPSEMTPRPASLDTHEFLTEEEINKKKYYVVNSTLKKGAENYNYSSVKKWITKDDFLTEKKEYYDKSGKLLKKMLITWKAAQKAWVWEKVVVDDLETGTQIIISINDVEVDTGFGDDIFSPDIMKKGLK